MREIGAALGGQIRQQTTTQLQLAIRTLERPVLPPRPFAASVRLAALFLKNTPDENRADPRLVPAQALVDLATATARERGDGKRAISIAGQSMRQRVADQIKTGSKLDIENVRPPDRDVDASAKNKGRGR